MGFGSYDESEQGGQAVDTDEEGAVSVHEHEHDGDVSVEGGDDTDALVGRLATMRDETDEE